MTEKAPRKPPRPPKRRWQPPRIKTGQLFESNSMACNKTMTDLGEQCQTQGATTS